jgi:single-stranded-DNA-specific exonuclease
LSRSRWNILPAVPEEYVFSSAGYSLLISQLLYNRGLSKLSHLESFIAADESLAGDPFLMPDVHNAVARIYKALLSGESIAVYGDFDTDGITATALVVQALSLLGGNVTPYIPHRLTEGYGLKTAALEKLQQQGISLVITVDCGITALNEVKKAKRKGLDIIITDHHTPSDNIPTANAIVNPRLSGSEYPFQELSGVGVALKLLQALFLSMGKEKQLDTLMDLVALGTVADMMPVLGENRYLIKTGLEVINTSPRLGISEMMNQMKLSQSSIDTESISWVIAPRLNAAGRLEHAMSSYRLLMTDSPQEANELAVWLEQKNTERQKLTTRALDIAKEHVMAQGIHPILITGDNEYPVGICGLVANRLADEFYRPAVVIRTGDRISSGSCRSIPEFNIIQALNQCGGLFLHFGGHAQAAGFTILTRNLPRLQQVLLESATQGLEGVDMRPRLDIDAEVKLSDLGGDTYPMIQKLAPFGQGNPVPVFISRNVEVIETRTMGNGGEHLRFRFRQNGTTWDAVGFRLGSYLSEVVSPLDIVYTLEIDSWNGQNTLRLNVIDFASGI